MKAATALPSPFLLRQSEMRRDGFTNLFGGMFTALSQEVEDHRNHLRPVGNRPHEASPAKRRSKLDRAWNSGDCARSGRKHGPPRCASASSSQDRKSTRLNSSHITIS